MVCGVRLVPSLRLLLIVDIVLYVELIVHVYDAELCVSALQLLPRLGRLSLIDLWRLVVL